MFEPIDYLEWIDKRVEDAVHDLGSSDLGNHHEGIPEFLEGVEKDIELVPYLAEEYGVSEENILVTAGATHANFIAEVAAVGEEKNEFLVEKPGYEPLRATPRELGGEVSRFERSEEQNHQLKPSVVENSVTRDTCMVTVTNRHNPSGYLSERDELEKVAEAVRDSNPDARLLIDEVYGPFVTEKTSEAFGGVTGSGIENTVITGSLTKFHGLGGIRVGWIIADKEFIEEARNVIMHVPSVSMASVELAERALSTNLEEEMRDLLKRNSQLLSDFVEDSVLEGEVFEGSTFCFAEHPNASGDEVVEKAWDEGILVIPGRFFDRPEKFRFCLSRDIPEKEAKKDLEDFEEVLENL